MNFARTNLSLLLARQCRQPIRRAPVVDLRQPPVQQVQVVAGTAAAAAATTSRLELVGAGATMLLFLVLALFG